MAIDADLNAGQITDEEARTAARGDRQRGRLLRRHGRCLQVRQGRRRGRRHDRRDQPDRRRSWSASCSGAWASATPSTPSRCSPIGDGLAAQIPALLISTATGIIVTRCGSDGRPRPRDHEPDARSSRRAPMIAGGVIIAMGLVPGLPKLPLPDRRRLLRRTRPGDEVAGHADCRRRARPAEAAEAATKQTQSRDQAEGALAIDPLELAIGFGLVPMVDQKSGGGLLARVGVVRRQIASELGIVIAPVRIYDDVALESHEYVIKVRGTEVARGRVIAGHRLAMNPGDASRRPGRHPDGRAGLRPARRVDRGGRAGRGRRRSATRSSTPSR